MLITKKSINSTENVFNNYKNYIYFPVNKICYQKKCDLTTIMHKSDITLIIVASHVKYNIHIPSLFCGLCPSLDDCQVFLFFNRIFIKKKILKEKYPQERIYNVVTILVDKKLTIYYICHDTATGIHAIQKYFS